MGKTELHVWQAVFTFIGLCAVVSFIAILILTFKATKQGKRHMKPDYTDAPAIGAPLTAREIKILDELKFDAAANDATLQIALKYHSNNANAVQRRTDEFWNELLETRNAPADNGNGFTVISRDGRRIIVDTQE